MKEPLLGTSCPHPSQNKKLFFIIVILSFVAVTVVFCYFVVKPSLGAKDNFIRDTPADILQEGSLTQLSETHAIIKTPSSEDTKVSETKSVDINKTPVIGILTQTAPLETKYGLEGYKSYMMTTYVNFFSTYEARVVPILWDESDEVTFKKLKGLNGVVFPGGAGRYIDKAKFVLSKAKEFNDNGSFFPIYGICLGFERLAIITSQAYQEGKKIL